MVKGDTSCTWVPDMGAPVYGRIVAERCGPNTGDITFEMETEGGGRVLLIHRMTLGNARWHNVNAGDLTGQRVGTLWK